MPLKILPIEAKDIRFPTSKSSDGPDAINKGPDYSAAYVILKTNNARHEGHGMAFTEGRGNETYVAAIKSLFYLLIGKSIDGITSEMAGFWRMITSDSQLRWLGPEKGIIHMATGAIVNVVRDLSAKIEDKTLWELIVDMTPEQWVACIDFTYLTDVLTPEESIQILLQWADSKQQRIEYLLKNNYPAYTTSVGRLGYPEEKIERLCRQATVEGWSYLKMKVGVDISRDIRRAEIIGEEEGSNIRLITDANQKWEVGEAIQNMELPKRRDPRWIEGPTSSDDILGASCY